MDRHRHYTPRELVEAATAQPAAAPGTRVAYSNTNYAVLGAIVERVAGMPFGAYLQTAVLDPLRLRHTRYGDRPGEARGYARDALESPVAPSSTSYAFAAAGMSSNVPDLLRWLAHVRAPYYGFFTAQMYGHEVIYASGSVDGYSAFALIAPQTRDALVILTNADALDLVPLAKSEFAALEPPTDRSFAAGFLPAQNEDAHVTRIVRGLLQDLQSGTVDAALLTPRFAAVLRGGNLRRWRERLQPLGAVASLGFTRRLISGSCRKVYYEITFAGGARMAIEVRLRESNLVDGLAVFDDR